jgi:hypothetical protein
MRDRGVALAIVLCAVLAVSAVGADGDDAAEDPVIPAGEEELVARILGRGVTLHDCTLTRGGVQFTVINATYDCPGGEVTLQLGHPRSATMAAAHTGQFALTLQSGSPPPGFGDALVSLIRSEEGDFQWSSPAYEGAAEDENADDGAPE